MSLICQGLLETFAGEALPDWERFARDVRTRRLAPGEALFEADRAWPWLAVVTAGVAKLVYPGDAEGARIKCFVAEGGFFASLAALSPRGRSSFAAVAVTELCVEQIPYAALRELGDRHVAWQRALRVGLEQYGAGKERLERERLMLPVQERYRRFLADEQAMVSRVSRSDLAQYLGVTPAVLSRLHGRLTRGS